MLRNLKASLRSWLIELMREAILLEEAERTRIRMPHEMLPTRPPDPYPMLATEMFMPKPASKPVTAPNQEPSFEQQEREAISAQEKYYEPAERLS